MNRRALLSASCLSLAGIAGCTGTARRRLSGRVEMDLATTVFHPADEPWFVGGLSAESEDDYHAELFAESPADVDDLFTDHYPRRDRPFENRIGNADYSSGFLLLFEAKMPRGRPFSVLPTILHGDLGWSGWRTVSAPMARTPRDPETLDFDDADELLSSTVVRYAAEATPSKAVVTVYDDETGGRVLRTTARPRDRS